jgi:hexosaminidase
MTEHPLETTLPLIPWPAEINLGSGTFKFSSGTKIYYHARDEMLGGLAVWLAELIEQSLGFHPEIVTREQSAGDMILLALDPGLIELAGEGYSLQIEQDGIQIKAYEPAGVFYGIQTLGQLLPRQRDHPNGELQAMIIRDQPRFAWRGFMLDVARHFFSVEDVKRVIDHIARYKFNRLHLHLTDDQGWRIEIKSWPELTNVGASTSVNGERGGFYTQADYAEIVAYATDRFVTVVPEIDLPGHTHAALTAYPQLSCDEQPREPYTGIEVGFSSLCIGKPVVEQFVTDVITEVATLTPDRYVHIGGDEAHATELDDYRKFIALAQKAVHTNGKIMVGWQEILKAQDLAESVLAQYWNPNDEVVLPEKNQVILSPGNRAYLDMQYQPGFPLGLHWAGYVSARDSYEWEPAKVLPGLHPGLVLGVEAALWTETLRTLADLEVMMFPRLACLAEVVWTRRNDKDWESFEKRLVQHKLMWEHLEIQFFNWAP